MYIVFLWLWTGQPERTRKHLNFTLCIWAPFYLQCLKQNQAVREEVQPTSCGVNKILTTFENACLQKTCLIRNNLTFTAFKKPCVFFYKFILWSPSRKHTSCHNVTELEKKYHWVLHLIVWSDLLESLLIYTSTPLSNLNFLWCLNNTFSRSHKLFVTLKYLFLATLRLGSKALSQDSLHMVICSWCFLWLTSFS